MNNFGLNFSKDIFWMNNLLKLQLSVIQNPIYLIITLFDDSLDAINFDFLENIEWKRFCKGQIFVNFKIVTIIITEKLAKI